MAIQMRRGSASDWMPGKMVAGEWAVILDDKKVFITFAPGDVKQLMTVEDAIVQLEQAIQTATAEAQGYATSASTSASASETSAQNSEYYANAAAESATNAYTSEENAKFSEGNAKDYSNDAEAWAVGQRNGEDVSRDDVTFENNSKFYSDIAKNLNADSQKVLADSKEILEAAQKKMQGANFTVDLNTGILMYNDDSDYTFYIDESNGELIWDYAS